MFDKVKDLNARALVMLHKSASEYLALKDLVEDEARMAEAFGGGNSEDNYDAGLGLNVAGLGFDDGPKAPFADPLQRKRLLEGALVEARNNLAADLRAVDTLMKAPAAVANHGESFLDGKAPSQMTPLELLRAHARLAALGHGKKARPSGDHGHPLQGGQSGHLPEGDDGTAQLLDLIAAAARAARADGVQEIPLEDVAAIAKAGKQW